MTTTVINAVLYNWSLLRVELKCFTHTKRDKYVKWGMC